MQSKLAFELGAITSSNRSNPQGVCAIAYGVEGSGRSPGRNEQAHASALSRKRPTVTALLSGRAEKDVGAGAATVGRPMHDRRTHTAGEIELVDQRRSIEQLDRVAIRNGSRRDAARTHVGEIEHRGGQARRADIHARDHAIGLEALPRRGVAEQKRAAVR